MPSLVGRRCAWNTCARGELLAAEVSRDPTLPSHSVFNVNNMCASNIGFEFTCYPVPPKERPDCLTIPSSRPLRSQASIGETSAGKLYSRTQGFLGSWETPKGSTFRPDPILKPALYHTIQYLDSSRLASFQFTFFFN